MKKNTILSLIGIATIFIFLEGCSYTPCLGPSGCQDYNSGGGGCSNIKFCRNGLVDPACTKGEAMCKSECNGASCGWGDPDKKLDCKDTSYNGVSGCCYVDACSNP